MKSCKRQVVRLTDINKPVSFKTISEVQEFLREYGYNFSKFEDIYELGKGGESRVLRIEPYIPMEVVAKMPIVTENTSD